MPRVSRKTFKSEFFHIISQGIEKKYIFNQQRCKEKYKKEMLKNLSKYKVDLLSYCIMDNHVHLLIHTEKITELSLYMQSINTAFALYYNKTNKRVGYVFRDRFKSAPVKNIKQLYRTLAYIHLNPVKAKMCSMPELYKYSSYNDYIDKKGVFDEKKLHLLEMTKENYLKQFVFLHYMNVEGVEYEDVLTKTKEERITEYINSHNIKDLIFESDKIEEMINSLEEENISFSNIAQYFNISSNRLKEIILK